MRRPATPLPGFDKPKTDLAPWDLRKADESQVANGTPKRAIENIEADGEKGQEKVVSPP